MECANSLAMVREYTGIQFESQHVPISRRADLIRNFAGECEEPIQKQIWLGKCDYLDPFQLLTLSLLLKRD